MVCFTSVILWASYILLARAATEIIEILQNPDVAGQRFIISQTNLHTTKFFTDALKARFPDFKIEDGEGGDDKKVIDNTAVSLLSSGFGCCVADPVAVQKSSKFSLIATAAFLEGKAFSYIESIA